MARLTDAPAGAALGAGTSGEDATERLHLMVENVRCGGCVASVERHLAAQPGVAAARVNLTTRRLTVDFRPARTAPDAIIRGLADQGYPARAFDPLRLNDTDARAERKLIRCMAVAGFAAANVMLLSVGVWAGHAQGMAPETRDLLHWFSAAIALPAVLYAGRPFFASTMQALSAGRANMDLPISLAVLLATAFSLLETIEGGAHAYFDSAVALLFFLLLGRFLDSRARGRARQTAERLLTLAADTANRIGSDGTAVRIPADALNEGDRILVSAGERIAADGIIVAGRSRLDQSLITGESMPEPAAPQTRVFAGTVNLEAPLTIEIDAAGDDTVLAGIVRLTEAAEQARSRYVALADRAARAYAPLVHLLALAAFIAWFAVIGAGWRDAGLIAIAVLIITCPCALGLAVPAVQVVAVGRLLRQGIMVKSATALERMASVDTIVFDKTGTLTLGQASLVGQAGIAPDAAALAAGMAATSRHPLAQALASTIPAPALDDVEEIPGAGLSMMTSAGEVRLGRRDWAVGAGKSLAPSDSLAEMWLSRPGLAPVRFAFDDPVRADAAETVEALKARGYRVILMSGDRAAAVRRVADRLRIDDARAALRPADKLLALDALAAEGRHVLMIGDGLNDAPALAAATASMSPSSATDISQNAADMVFQGERLAPIIETLAVASRARRLVRQNFGLAIGYNAVAVPLAMIGLVTPLLAAIAMSTSSLIVVGNALRLGGGRTGPSTGR